jgi:hypothetical protein
MPEQDASHDSDLISAGDLRTLLSQEVRDAAKAFELRIRELSELTTAYAAGEITPREANSRYRAFQDRWGDALLGATAADGVSDQRILEDIDRIRAQREAFVQRLGKEKQRSGI